MTLSVRATTWKAVKNVWVKDAGIWKQAKSVWVKDGGVWKQSYIGAYTIPSDTANLNLRTLANANGYTGSGGFSFILGSGIEIYSTSAGTPSLVPGSWPAGVTVSFDKRLGTVSGCGGYGGAAGGTAIDASTVSGFTFSVDNTGAVIRGGGGGGAVGTDGPYTFPGPCCSPSTTYTAGGGGGGGGQGRNGGTGGPGNATSGGVGGWVPSSSGSNGSSSAPGAGGAGGFVNNNCGFLGATGGTGGAGGVWGTAGSGGGGAAGKSVNGNANITWVGTGTRTGPVV